MLSVHTPRHSGLHPQRHLCASCPAAPTKASRAARRRLPRQPVVGVVMAKANGDSDLGNQQRLERLYEGFKHKFKEVPELTATELNDMLMAAPDQAARLVLVDTRTAAEQQVSVLPGNTLTQQEFEQRSGQFREHKVVCYCTAGYRSGLYAQQLRSRGFDAYNLAGSILSWTHAGLPLVERADRSKQTKRVHVFSKDWALQGEGYEPVQFQAPLFRLAWDFVSSRLQRPKT